MPIVAPSYVSITGQVDPTSAPQSAQLNLRQMIGEVLQWNPDAPPLLVKSWIQNAYRRIVDFRLWYGTLIRGQVTVPNVYQTGVATFTLGSAVVTGVGTNWTASMVNRQIRAGFSTGFYNIASVQSATQLTMDLPWGNPTLTSVGYTIYQTWITLGYNIKSVLEMVNQRQGWKLRLNMPQAVLNEYDTWRTTTGWTFILGNKEPTAAGVPQFELYPAPTFQQNFPFLAYIQPQDLTQDGQTPATFIRSDILVLAGIKDALLYKGKNTKYYDPQTAGIKNKEFDYELTKMALNDDNLYLKDFSWDYSRWPYYQYGAQFMQSHAGPPGEL